MAPETPADTAGPSSPPPRLPEGWLPQWEGVQRKWYYVQRTTGESQWEIPTEPVVLTPSTTPTPVGTGPSSAPTSHALEDGARLILSGDRMADGSYPSADSAKISNSLHSQIYGQSDDPIHGSPGVSVCCSNQTGQHLPDGCEQQRIANAAGYGPNPLQQGPGVEANRAQSGLYKSQTLPFYHTAGFHNQSQPIHSCAWGNDQGIFPKYPSGHNMGGNPQPLLGFPAGPLQGHQPPASWTLRSNLKGQARREMAEMCPSQSQWQLQPQHGHFGAPGEGTHMNMHPSNQPQQFFGSYSPHQNCDTASREFARRSSNTSPIREGQPCHSSVGNFSANPPQSTIDQARFSQGYLISGSHSQHPPADPALQGFSPLQNVQVQYQQQHMIRAHPDLSVAQDRGQYQHPPAQSVNPFVAQNQLAASNGSAGFPESTHVPQVPYHQPSYHLEPSSGEKRRASDFQFISGPWTSTPPSAAQL